MNNFLKIIIKKEKGRMIYTFYSISSAALLE
jgi:hypothetical protein